jgi:hypothetical protein
MTFPHTPPPDGIGYFVLYYVEADGTLQWVRREAEGGGYEGPKPVGNGWEGFVDVIAAGGNCLYARQPDGTLLWYRHDGFDDGTFAWTGSHTVGNGWNFPTIFPGGDGIVYAITDEGMLFWYRHLEFRTGGDVSTWVQRREVGHGWSAFRRVTGNGKGHIFALTEADELFHYVHTGYADGAPTWGPRAVNRQFTWSIVERMIPVGSQQLLGVTSSGYLLYFRQLGTAPPPPGHLDEDWQDSWLTPRSKADVFDEGWNAYLAGFALLPTDPVAPR